MWRSGCIELGRTNLDNNEYRKRLGQISGVTRGVPGAHPGAFSERNIGKIGGNKRGRERKKKKEKRERKEKGNGKEKGEGKGENKEKRKKKNERVEKGRGNERKK